MKLLNTDPSFDGQPQSHIRSKWSLLPFLGDALKWLTGTATTKDINTIKTRINQLIATQSSQQETLVHIVSGAKCHMLHSTNQLPEHQYSHR